jgi:glycosyltransferase involved in cell wall biosynthesis
MQICHVNLASGYHGGENQTLQLIKEQLRLGYQLTVVAKSNSPFAQAVQELGCTVILTSHYLRQHSPSITAGCQLIHVHEGRALYWAMLQKMRTGCPYIVTRRIDNRLKDRRLLRRGYLGAAALVGLSSEIARRITDRFPKVTPHIIPSSPVDYPVNPESVAHIKAKYKGKFLVIQAANMVKHKGFDVTINAARYLELDAPNIHIALLGDGKLRKKLESKASGLSNLSFEGTQHNMGDWFNAADLQIHPSYTEGLGSVILEGMNAGLAVVATRVGGIPDIITHKHNGLLLSPGDAKGLADTINQLSGNQARLDELKLAAKQSLAKFDIKTTALQYQSLYQSVTSGQPSSTAS